MGKYWATWSGQNEEGYYINYELEFFEEIDGKLAVAALSRSAEHLVVAIYLGFV